MTKVINLDLSPMFKEDQEREDRAGYLARMSKADSFTMLEACELLADIITDAPRYGKAVTYGEHRGVMDTIVTNPALAILKRLATLEAQVAEYALRDAVANKNAK